MEHVDVGGILPIPPKGEEEKPKVDARVEGYRLAKTSRDWREVREGLHGLGVKDPEAKRVAKEIMKGR